MKSLLPLLAIALTIIPLRAMDENPPNFVFIIADDLGWADVAFHGGNAPTPHLDKLAAQSLELTQHYVAPVCSPTRAGFLTGRLWSRFGITTPINTRGLPWDTVTVGRALGSVGYDTCLIGKWHLGSKPDWGPNKFGFHHAYGSLAGGISPWNHRYKKGPYSFTWHRNGELIQEEGHVTDLLTDEALKWIRSRDESPFFLYLPYTAIHLPLKEPNKWVDRVPPSIKGEVPRHYAASIIHLDDAVGRILKALDETGRRENTLLIFTSDNGGSTAENNDLKYPNDNCPNGPLVGNNLPLRGQKGTIYEGGTRVPTIVSWPTKIRPGKQDAPVYVADWMPTFSALAGYLPNRNLNWDGVDLSDLLLKNEALDTRPLYIAAPRWREVSLRYGDWKLIKTENNGKTSSELYNIRLDPSESSNQMKQEPKLARRLLEMLKNAESQDNEFVVGNPTL